MAGDGTGVDMVSSDEVANGASPSVGAKPARPRRIAIETLMRESTEVILVHRGTDYRLRVTANRKLILTK